MLLCAFLVVESCTRAMFCDRLWMFRKNLKMKFLLCVLLCVFSTRAHFCGEENSDMNALWEEYKVSFFFLLILCNFVMHDRRFFYFRALNCWQNNIVSSINTEKNVSLCSCRKYYLIVLQIWLIYRHIFINITSAILSNVVRRLGYEIVEWSGTTTSKPERADMVSHFLLTIWQTW